MILTDPSTIENGTITEANKWKWWRALIAIVCPFCEIILSYTNNGENRGNVNGISSDELTTIQDFFKNRFIAFLNTYAAQAENIIKSGSLSEDELAVLNNTINMLCMIRTYFARENNPRLSAGALSYRNQMLFDIIDHIQDKITAYIQLYYPGATAIATTVVPANYDLSMIIDKPVPGKYECITYTPSLSTQIVKRTVAAAQSVAATIAPAVKTEPTKSNTGAIVTVLVLLGIGIAVVSNK